MSLQIQSGLKLVHGTMISPKPTFSLRAGSKTMQNILSSDVTIRALHLRTTKIYSLSYCTNSSKMHSDCVPASVPDTSTLQQVVHPAAVTTIHTGTPCHHLAILPILNFAEHRNNRSKKFRSCLANPGHHILKLYTWKNRPDSGRSRTC